ncbi:oligosaccharide flippase family protein [Halobacillus sp. Marseille-Q1614]|uniref:oligosaccharide flippase family protein n=1 Tax=Halobacillus sp. Marseille-Q1614 TaxID=2709134 RepID=UPI00156FA8D2|nr:oligosaccharide flippase family protein [Halobacillus sp. Marseille-Q1614]
MFLKHLKNLLYLFTSKGVASSFAFIAQIILARLLTQEDYGTVSFYIVFINILSSIIGYGLGNFWLRRYAVEGFNVKRWIKPSLMSGICLTGITMPIYFIVPYFSLGEHSLFISLALLPLLIFQGFSQIVRACFQILGKYNKLSYYMLIKNSIFLLSALILFLFDFNSFVAIYGILSLLVLLYSLTIVKGFYNISTYRAEMSGVIEEPKTKLVLKLAWPFGAQGILYMLYYQVDILMITFFLGTTSTGLYNASFTIVSLIFVFPSILFQIYLLPKANVWIANNELNKINFIRKKLSIILFLLGISITLILFYIGEFLITLLFGAEFLDSALLFKVLILSVPFRFVTNSLEMIFATERMVTYKVYIQAGGALLNIFLNLIFINQIGVIGAAISTVITEIFIFLLYYFLSARLKREM